MGAAEKATDHVGRTLAEATTEELAEALRGRLSPDGIEAAKKIVQHGLSDKEEAHRLAVEVVEAIDRLTKAVEAQTKQVESSTIEIAGELKFIGTQLVHLYERHFDTVR